MIIKINYWFITAMLQFDLETNWFRYNTIIWSAAKHETSQLITCHFRIVRAEPEYTK